MEFKYDSELKPEDQLKARASLNKHFSEIKKKLKQPSKNATAGKGSKFSYKYATLDAVLSAIDEASVKVGLTYLQEPVNVQGFIGVKTYLMDESGAIAEFAPFLVPAGKTAQDYGSALTYARRYSISAVFGVASEEDDDAEQASYTANNYQRRSNYSSSTNQNYRRNNQSSKKTVATKPKQEPLSANEKRLAQVNVEFNGKQVPLMNIAKGVSEKKQAAIDYSKQLKDDKAKDFAEIVTLQLWKKFEK